MADVTYKCPSCGGYLTFDPDEQKWACPYCNSFFDEADIAEKEEQMQQQAETQEPEYVPTADGKQVVYRCQSCGSEIVTDETTVATQCYYCHSPVVLQGKLQDDMRPDSVLPFAISKEKAVSEFMNWVKSKKYVPKGFFSQSQVETINGVYYPHFVAECDVDGSIDGTGRNVSVATTSEYVVTSTRHYHVRRAADMHFQNIMRPALSSTNRKLSDGIHPFPLQDAKPFAGSYLSGFLAERRDLEASSIADDVGQEVSKYVEPLLVEDLHYDNYSVRADASVHDLKTKYVLLPTWVLTYPNKNDVNNPYYYAMNGCTGEVCGKLPIDKRKLFLKSLLKGGIVFLLCCVLMYFFF